MPVIESQSIQAVALHRVGNQATQEGYVVSNRLLTLSEQLQDLMVQYFCTPFKAEEYYHLYHEDGVDHNVVYRCARSIFANGEELLGESQTLAHHLYEQSVHANIKGGDFFTVLFHDVLFNGETMDALGLFKAENKESFLQVGHGDEQWSRRDGEAQAMADFHVDVQQGINLHKLDKGALIFNTEQDQGYVVAVVDATNKALDAAYWRDGFLGLCQRQDEYYNTHEVMKAYRQFVTDELPSQYDNVSKADQADLLNKSVTFFKENEAFDMGDFERDVLQQPEVIDSFGRFRQQYEQNNEVQLPDHFDINENAVKKQARVFRSVIKLDKNFHIYVHGNRDLIEQGEDEKGKYYKVYYREES